MFGLLDPNILVYLGVYIKNEGIERRQVITDLIHLSASRYYTKTMVNGNQGLRLMQRYCPFFATSYFSLIFH